MECILHITDLLNDAKAGKIAGPFKLHASKAKVFVINKNGRIRENTFFPAKRKCTAKAKRLQTMGRRVTDLTGNGLNAL